MTTKELHIWFVIIVILFLTSCGKELSSGGDDGRAITFLTDIPSVETRSVQAVFTSPAVPIHATPAMPESLMLYTQEEDGFPSAGPDTRGAQTGISSAFRFGVSEFTGSGTAVSSFQNVSPYYESNSTTQRFNSGKSWEADAITGTAYGFYAYAPYISSSTNGMTLNSGNKTIAYNMSSVTAANQPDLMTAYASSSYAATVPLTFSHRLCAIRVVLGSSWRQGFSVTSVKFNSIYTQGTLAIQTGAWTLSGSKGNYTVSGINTAVTTPGDAVVGEPSTYLMMVPQTLSGASLEIVLKDTSGKSYTLSATITGTWTAGKTVTYTLNPAGITSMTATYPTWTLSGESTTDYGPVGTYDVGDAQFGLYAVKGGSIILSNIPIGVKSVSGHVATLDLPDNLYLPKTGTTYFLYYPYKSSPGTVTASGTTANAFFEGVINNWPVATTQNNATLYKQQDLQVAMRAGTATSTFSMVHKMGLAKVTIANKTVKMNYTETTSLNSSGTVVTTNSSSGNNVTLHTITELSDATALRLFKNGSNFWTIVKPSTSVSLSSTQGDNDAWTLSVSGISAGQYKTYSAQSARKGWNYTMNFDCTGTKIALTVPLNGTYKFYVWGAQGYSVNHKRSDNVTITRTGGYGGYSYGEMTLTKGSVIYIYVGETGAGGVSSYNNYAFPNGGGNQGNADSIVGTGGGASLITNKDVNITSKTSLKDNLADSNILIMAGGGGAATQSYPNGSNWSTSWAGHGGAGGGCEGYSGSKNNQFPAGKGGTQSAGGAAGNSSQNGVKLAGGGISTAIGTGGGGGYYGGGASWGAPGGGGSGYIGNSNLSNKKMVSYYNASAGLTSDTSAHTSTNASTYTVSTTNVSATPTADYAKIGNGYIRIVSAL